MKNLTKKLLAVALPVSALTIGSGANALTLTFDEDFIDHGTIINEQYADLGVSISAVNNSRGPDLAVAYDTTARPANRFTNRDADLTGDFGTGNALIIQENRFCSYTKCYLADDEGSRPSGSLFFSFDYVINSFSFDFIDIEEPEVTGAEIRYFDDSSNVVGSISFDSLDEVVFGDNTFNSTDDISLAGLGVTTLEFVLGGSGALDNISVSTVPLPASASIFALGLFGLQAFRRRMQKKTKAA